MLPACLSSNPISFKPILDSDPEFYRSHGESVLSAVRNASRVGHNGELLGYGARSMDARGAVPIRIFNDESELFAFFMSDPRVAEFYARERLLDIATYTNDDLSYLIGQL